MMETIDSTNWGLLSLVADLHRRTSPQPGAESAFLMH